MFAKSIWKVLTLDSPILNQNLFNHSSGKPHKVIKARLKIVGKDIHTQYNFKAMTFDTAHILKTS